MFEAYVASDAQTEEEERWNTMKPFSASDIAPPVKAPVPPPTVSPHHVPIRRAARDHMRSLVRLNNPFRPPPAPPPLPPPAIELAPQSSVIPPPSAKLRVALLVAMPWQQVAPQDEDEEELPYLEFGVLDADVVDLGKVSTSESESGRADLGTKS